MQRSNLRLSVAAAAVILAAIGVAVAQQPFTQIMRYNQTEADNRAF